MLANLSTSTIVTLVTGVAAALTALSGIVTTLGVGPRSADAMFALLFASMASYWVFVGWRDSTLKRPAGLTPHPAPDSLAARAHRALPQLAFAGLLLSAAAWFGAPVGSDLASPRWELCATVVSPCSASYCAQLADHRGRPVTRECVRPADGTGLIRLTSSNATGYRPVSIRVECKDRSIPAVPLTAAMFDGGCRAVLELP